MKYLITLILILSFLNIIKADDGLVYTQFQVSDAGCMLSPTINNYTLNIDECSGIPTCNARLSIGFNSTSDEYYVYVFDINDTQCVNSGQNQEVSARFKCEDTVTLGAISITCLNPVMPTNFTIFEILNAKESCGNTTELEVCKSACGGSFSISKNPVIFNGYIASFYQDSQCDENSTPFNSGLTCLSNNKAISINDYSITCKVLGTPAPGASSDSSNSSSQSNSSNSSSQSNSSSNDGSNASIIKISIALLALLNIVSLLF